MPGQKRKRSISNKSIDPEIIEINPPLRARTVVDMRKVGIEEKLYHFPKRVKIEPQSKELRVEYKSQINLVKV